MSEISNAPRNPENTLILPESIPQALGALALLTPEEELQRRSWVNETDPHNKVESFLEATSSFFIASEQAWNFVRTAQTQVIEHDTEVQRRAAQYAAPQNRKNRRNNKKAQQYTSSHATFASIKHAATMGFTGFEGETVQEKIATFCGQMNEIQDEHKANEQRIKGIDVTRTRLTAKLLDSYCWTQATQRLIEEEVAQLLGEPETSRSFVHKIHELADNARHGVVEYPGFLESLALNQAISTKDSLLRQASDCGAWPSTHYALEFLENPTVTHSREAGIALKAIRLSAQFFEQRPQSESLRNSYMRYIAGATSQWPQDLRNGLEVYTLARNGDAHASVTAATKPSLRPGRLPAQIHGTAIIQVLPSGKVVKAKRAKPVRDRSKENNPSPMFFIEKGEQDHEDVTPEKQPPITKFAFFNGAGGRDDRFSLGPICTIDEILEKGQIRNYIDDYVGEAALESAIKAGLESLSTDPFNRDRTTRLVKGGYVLDGKQGRMRRLSLRRFPGITTGRTANKTRVYYDVVITPDGPVIGIYGAVTKQDSEKSDRLPPR